MSITLPNHFYHLRGKDQSGPTVLLMGGTHGDELTGIGLVQRALKSLGIDVDPLQAISMVIDREDIKGNLILGFGNPAAIKLKKRGASEIRDLNRSFQERDLIGEGQECVDIQRAREIAPFLESVDYLFDIHATSSPTPAFVCFGKDDELHHDLYRYIPVEYILTDPDNFLVFEEKNVDYLATTDNYVDTKGGSEWGIRTFGEKRGVAICYETGQEEDMEQVEPTLQTVLQLLLHVGVITEDFCKAIGVEPAKHPVQTQGVYALGKPVVATEKAFVYEPGMNKGWQQVKKGQIVGRYVESGIEVRVPESGMLLFPKKIEKIKVGRKIFNIARRIR